MPELNFNALAQQGPQGVYQGFMQGQQLRNQLAGQEQQRQLGELQLQNALREQRLAGEEEAAYKAAGNDYARLQSELMQRGLGKQALAVGAQQAKMRADQLKMHKDTVELTKTAAQQVMANPQNAVQILSSFGQRYGIDMADDLAQIQQLGGNSDAIRQWAAGVAVQADKLLPKFETMNLGGAVVMGRVNPLTGQFEQTGAMRKTMTPGDSARLALDQQKFAWEKANPGYEIKDTDTGYVAVNRRNPADVRPITMGAGGEQVTSSKGLTEAQAKATGFAARAKEADKIIGASKAAPWQVASKQGVEGIYGLGGPLGAVANVMLPEEAQKADQAQRDFVNAVLRQESGAAISEAEFQNARKQYFPQPGDSASVIKQKAKNRATAIQSLEVVAGPGMRKMEKANKSEAPAGVIDFGSLK